MATITRDGNFIMITSIAADVTAIQIFKDDKEKLIKRIEFLGGAASDVCVVKQGSATGAIITTLMAGEYKFVDRCYFGEKGVWMLPFVDFSACTLNASHVLVIELA